MTTQPAKLNSLAEILDRTRAATTGETVVVRDVIESLGSASFLSIQLLMALAVTSPLSGFPFFSSVSGLVIFLVVAQSLIGRTHVWLPDFLARRQLPVDKVKRVLNGASGVVHWLDDHRWSNLPFVTEPPFENLPRALCMFCGAAMPLLEIVPFSSAILGAVVSGLTFGMLTRNGLLVLLTISVTVGGAVAFGVLLV